jgi:molybdopterin molybdotransferase
VTRHQIPAASACGYDDTAHELLSPDPALRRGLGLCRPVAGTEVLPLEAANGRVLAGPATAALPLPPFDSSAMDAYALRRADLSGPGPRRIFVAGRIAAGIAAPVQIPAGAALRIFTGAPVPADCDAVVMQERVTRAGDSILLDRLPQPGENIRRAGEDLSAGANILPAGRVIGAREAAALAAVGLGRVAVCRPVRVAIFATGSELRMPGEPLGPGQIWNSNRSQLRAALAAP